MVDSFLWMGDRAGKKMAACFIPSCRGRPAKGKAGAAAVD